MYSASSGHVLWNSTMNQQPAYMPVPAHHAYISQHGLPPPPTYVPQPFSASQQSIPLASSVAAPGSTSISQARKKTEWPPDVRDYVSRCFAPENQVKDIAKAELEAKLKRIITDAAQTNQLHSLNWQQLALPQQMIQDERRRAVLTPQFPFPPISPVPFPPSNQPFPHTDALRKRKSSELGVDVNEPNVNPWQKPQTTPSFEDRITHPQHTGKRHKLDSGKSESKSNGNLEQRKRRFENSGPPSPQKFGASNNGTPQPEPIGPVVGRSQQLEKHYFRLTSAPNPDDVRPLSVLKQTLELLKTKWRSESNYVYICDQFKSLRQDLTVQRIKTDFTTSVYEIHARIALEKGDLGEYNQCQTQLRSLYKQNLGGHPSEFMAYRILYLIHTCNRTDMNDVLSDLTPVDKSQEAVKHALQVRSALALGDYHKFFKLYLSVPNMGGYLMDMFVERERLAAMARICRAYKPDVRLRLITEELAFESDEDTARFMLDHDAGVLLQKKEDHVRLLTGKAGPLFEDARQAAFRQVDIKGQI